jgi:hypothetical protein
MISRNTRGSTYGIEGYNDRTKSTLTILALTDKNSFERNRKIMAYSLLGIEDSDNAKKALTTLLNDEDYAGMSSLLNREEQAERLAEGLLSGDITPYEAVGIIKDHNPALKTKEMTQLWTKLSLITGLETLQAESLHKNWTESVKQNSLSPRLKALNDSLEEPKINKKNPYLKKSYKENFPHLKDSTLQQTNWEEIISNLSPQKAGFLKALLNSSKENILKNEARDGMLFPQPSIPEIENRRLEKIINVVGNQTNNRLKRYQRVMFNLENHRRVEGLPDRGLPEPTENEVKLSKKLIIEIDKGFEEVRNNKTLDKEEIEIKVKGLLLWLKSKLFKLKKINLKEAQETWQKYKPLLEKVEKGEKYERVLLKLRSGQAIDPQTILDKIKELCERTTGRINEQGVGALLAHIDDISKYEKTLRSEPFNKSSCIKGLLDKTPTVDPASPPLGRGMLLATGDLSTLPYSLDTKLGKSKKSPLHIVSRVGTTEEIQQVAKQMKSQGLSLDEQSTKFGDTALHYGTPSAIKTLVSLGADPNIRNKDGGLPHQTNPYPENRDILKKHRKKTIAKDIVKKVGEEEIDIL